MLEPILFLVVQSFINQSLPGKPVVQRRQTDFSLQLDSTAQCDRSFVSMVTDLHRFLSAGLVL